MCWSTEASLTTAAISTSATVYAIAKRYSPLLWVPVLFFTLMEILQALQYIYLDNPYTNQILTAIVFVHITLQPVFFNMLGLYFIPKAKRLRWWPLVMAACAGVAILTATQLLFHTTFGNCIAGAPFCGEAFQTYMGAWHIAWLFPLNGMSEMLAVIPILERSSTVALPFYAVGAMLLPFLYGSWRFGLYSLAFPVIIMSVIADKSEAAAVWCIFSVGIAAVLLIPKMQQWLRVGGRE